MLASFSPSSRMIRTPCVLRPIRLMSAARMRGVPAGAAGASDPAGACLGVLLVENREDAGALLAAAVTLGNLRPSAGRRWRAVVACPDGAWGFYERGLSFCGAALRRVALEPWELPGRCFEIEAYNALCKRASFWERVSEHCGEALTVQGDGLLARRPPGGHPLLGDGPADPGVEYAGAPWAEDPWLSRAAGWEMVGNGGFSWRRPAACARACREAEAEGRSCSLYWMAPHMSVPEDVFFSSRLRTLGRAEASAFSTEQVASPGALGYHQFWRYHPPALAAEHLGRLLAEASARLPPSGDLDEGPVPAEGLGVEGSAEVPAGGLVDEADGAAAGGEDGADADAPPGPVLAPG